MNEFDRSWIQEIEASVGALTRAFSSLDNRISALERQQPVGGWGQLDTEKHPDDYLGPPNA